MVSTDGPPALAAIVDLVRREQQVRLVFAPRLVTRVHQAPGPVGPSQVRSTVDISCNVTHISVLVAYGVPARLARFNLIATTDLVLESATMPNAFRAQRASLLRGDFFPRNEDSRSGFSGVRLTDLRATDLTVPHAIETSSVAVRGADPSVLRAMAPIARRAVHEVVCAERVNGCRAA